MLGPCQMRGPYADADLQSGMGALECVAELFEPAFLGVPVVYTVLLSRK